ncbi:MAG TPA: sigma-70 family RNA polymerase sigma factor [Casimicrobiaceae bacterium]|jgi:RNA polymerase sigma-70 factor (ECF subfamily)|nr:sigma-70 family RNA polymerase sigma factor [Casimicrobiaceae bacterium]
MASGSRDRVPPLTLVSSAPTYAEADGTAGGPSGKKAPARDLDWSILMARAQGGDGEAYRRLLSEIAPYLQSLARRHHRDSGDVEDTVQDVLLTVHAIRHTYDPSRPFGPWLLAIAKRRIIDRLRRQGRTRAREVALDVEHETFCAPETNLGEADWNKRVLGEAIEGLPPGQREAVRLLKLHEMSLQQAAVASGMSVAALKVAMHRALKNLRKMLTKSGGET